MRDGLQCLARAGRRPTIVCIDGIDECSEWRREFADVADSAIQHSLVRVRRVDDHRATTGLDIDTLRILFGAM